MIRQLPLPFAHRPDYATAVFLQACSNAQALTWLERPAEWPQHRLALWGAPGCGKTHLLRRWAILTGAAVLDGPSLQLEPPTGPVAVDNADGAPEIALLHLLNAAGEAGFPLVMAAAAAPARWTTDLADLSSRLRATLAVEIHVPEDSLMRALLARLLADRQLAVAAPLQEHLLRHLPRTPATLREAAARLDRLALASGSRITRALASVVIEELADREVLAAGHVSASQAGTDVL